MHLNASLSAAKMGPLKVLLLYGLVSGKFSYRNSIFLHIYSCFRTVASRQLREDVALDSNVTLNCTYRGAVRWKIIGGGGSNSSLTIYLNRGKLEAAERGIVPVAHQMAGDANVNRLRVLGSIENNQTEIQCMKSGTGSETIVSYILTVVGKSLPICASASKH